MGQALACAASGGGDELVFVVGEACAGREMRPSERIRCDSSEVVPDTPSCRRVFPPCGRHPGVPQPRPLRGACFAQADLHYRKPIMDNRIARTASRAYKEWVGFAGRYRAVEHSRHLARLSLERVRRRPPAPSGIQAHPRRESHEPDGQPGRSHRADPKRNCPATPAGRAVPAGGANHYLPATAFSMLRGTASL